MSPVVVHFILIWPKAIELVASILLISRCFAQSRVTSMSGRRLSFNLKPYMTSFGLIPKVAECVLHMIRMMVDKCWGQFCQGEVEVIYVTVGYKELGTFGSKQRC
jgi:hypothetical protein